MSNGFCKNRGYVVFYCYISSNSVLFLMFWTFVAFNTSHVKVNLCQRRIFHQFLYSFNTSHVKVYQSAFANMATDSEHFNTSHVKVYLLQIAGF